VKKPSEVYCPTCPPMLSTMHPLQRAKDGVRAYSCPKCRTTVVVQEHRADTHDRSSDCGAGQAEFGTNSDLRVEQAFRRGVVHGLQAAVLVARENPKWPSLASLTALRDHAQELRNHPRKAVGAYVPTLVNLARPKPKIPPKPTQPVQDLNGFASPVLSQQELEAIERKRYQREMREDW
jgi:hypothetical protein